MEKLPRLVKNLDGEIALRVEAGVGRKGTFDLRSIFGILEMDKEEKEQYECESVLMTSWGSIKILHPAEVIVDLLYPFDVGD